MYLIYFTYHVSGMLTYGKSIRTYDTSTCPKKNIKNIFILQIGFVDNKNNGSVAQMVERALSMREVRGSMPLSSSFLIFFWVLYTFEATPAGVDREIFASLRAGTGIFITLVVVTTCSSR